MNEETIFYHVRLSRRAKWMRIQIRPDTGVVVTAPLSAGSDEIQVFLARHKRWIARQLSRFSQTHQRIPKRWPYGQTLPYRGQEFAVEIQAGRPARVLQEGNQISVLLVRPTIENARRLLRRWYVQEALRVLGETVKRWAPALGVDWKRVGVGNQRSRWGSCSAAGTLRFNYRLVMAPPEILDYVVVHELAHRKELNHSSRFWGLVERHVPDYKTARRWLTTDGLYLGV